MVWRRGCSPHGYWGAGATGTPPPACSLQAGSEGRRPLTCAKAMGLAGPSSWGLRPGGGAGLDEEEGLGVGLCYDLLCPPCPPVPRQWLCPPLCPPAPRPPPLERRLSTIKCTWPLGSTEAHPWTLNPWPPSAVPWAPSALCVFPRPVCHTGARPAGPGEWG